MKLYNEKKKELNDAAILAAIKDAERLFEGGCLVETRDLLAEVADAIDEFEKSYTV